MYFRDRFMLNYLCNIFGGFFYNGSFLCFFLLNFFDIDGYDQENQRVYLIDRQYLQELNDFYFLRLIIFFKIYKLNCSYKIIFFLKLYFYEIFLD